MARHTRWLLVSGLVLGGLAVTTAMQVRSVQHEDDYDIGYRWIGLAGLVGLASLMRGDRHNPDRTVTA